MRRLVHVSDLHFGRIRPGLVRGLAADIDAFDPHLVVVTGDLTQRATAAQFESAREFLADLGRTVLVVPGNHDIAPLYRPLARLFAPYTQYKRCLGAELDTTFVDEQLLVLGLNSVLPLRWKEGGVSRAQLAWILRTRAQYPGRFAVLAAHHPLAGTLQPTQMKTVRRHSDLLDTLEQATVSLCLTGHLHFSLAAPFATAAGGAHATLVVRASTATSTRLRGHRNAYNRIVIRPPQLSVEVRSWTGDGFETDAVECFRQRGREWRGGRLATAMSRSRAAETEPAAGE